MKRSTKGYVPCYQRSQRREGAANAHPLLKRALAICAKGDMSPNHELVRTVLANLGALYGITTAATMPSG